MGRIGPYRVIEGFAVLRTKVRVRTSKSGRTTTMRNKGLGALVLSAAALGLAMPASALAAKPTVTTGGVSGVSFQGARLNGRVDAEQGGDDLLVLYGTTIAFGSETAPADAGGGNRPPPARRHRRARPGDEVLLPDRRQEQLGHRARQAALVRHAPAAARRLARGGPEPGQGEQLGNDAVRHADRHQQRRPQGGPAGQRVAVHRRLRSAATSRSPTPPAASRSRSCRTRSTPSTGC